MQDPKIRPRKMIDIEANCVKAVDMYMQVKVESNDFIKWVHKISRIYPATILATQPASGGP